MSDYTPDLSDAQSYYVAGRAQLRRHITGEQAIDVTEYSHEFDRMIAAVERAAAEKAWGEGQKSGMRYTERMRAAYEIGRPELPGPPSQNPYGAAALGLTAGQEEETA